MKTLLFLLLCAGAASAQTYDYSDGNPAFTGDVTLLSPLPQNGTVDVTPQSFAFLAAGFGINSPVPGIFVGQGWQGGETFQFTTVSGQITAWNVSMNLYASSANSNTMIFDLSNAGDSYTQTSCFSNQGCEITGQASSAPGAWTSAPEMDASTAFAALSLLGGGLLVWRKRQSTDTHSVSAVA